MKPDGVGSKRHDISKWWRKPSAEGRIRPLQASQAPYGLVAKGYTFGSEWPTQSTTNTLALSHSAKYPLFPLALNIFI